MGESCNRIFFLKKRQNFTLFPTYSNILWAFPSDNASLALRELARKQKSPPLSSPANLALIAAQNQLGSGCKGRRWTPGCASEYEETVQSSPNGTQGPHARLSTKWIIYSPHWFNILYHISVLYAKNIYIQKVCNFEENVATWDIIFRVWLTGLWLKIWLKCVKINVFFVNYGNMQ